jgi:hypothetical protein
MWVTKAFNGTVHCGSVGTLRARMRGAQRGCFKGHSGFSCNIEPEGKVMGIKPKGNAKRLDLLAGLG